MMKMSSTVAYIILLIGIGDIAKQLDGYLYIPTSKSNQLYHDLLEIKKYTKKFALLMININFKIFQWSDIIKFKGCPPETQTYMIS